MSKGKKDMILMNCQAACIYLPREIFIPCKTLSLREVTMEVLLDLELYGIVKKRCRFRATFCPVKSGVLKF